MVTTAGHAKRCGAKNRAGEPCAAFAGDSGFCFFHDPGRAAECKAARSQGGRARHGRRLGAGGGAGGAPVEIETVADVIRLLGRAINDALALENSIQRARVLGYLGGVAIKALEVGGLEDRVGELERVLKERKP